MAMDLIQRCMTPRKATSGAPVIALERLKLRKSDALDILSHAKVDTMDCVGVDGGWPPRLARVGHAGTAWQFDKGPSLLT